jgi:hypothetical protein
VSSLVSVLLCWRSAPDSFLPAIGAGCTTGATETDVRNMSRIRVCEYIFSHHLDSVLGQLAMVKPPGKAHRESACKTHFEKACYESQ